jgi:hypothetical protein
MWWPRGEGAKKTWRVALDGFEKIKYLMHRGLYN